MGVLCRESLAWPRVEGWEGGEAALALARTPRPAHHGFHVCHAPHIPPTDRVRIEIWVTTKLRGAGWAGARVVCDERRTESGSRAPAAPRAVMGILAEGGPALRAGHCVACAAVCEGGEWGGGNAAWPTRRPAYHPLHVGHGADVPSTEVAIKGLGLIKLRVRSVRACEGWYDAALVNVNPVAVRDFRASEG